MKIHFKTKEETDKNKQLKKETNQKKASYFLGFSIFILLFDLFTYAVALVMNLFDFGIFFELFALVFAILALFACNKGNFKNSKLYIFLSSFPILLLASYDTIETIVNIDFYLEKLLYRYIELTDLLAITIFLILFFNYISYSCIKKIEETSSNDEVNKNWFYEEY